MIQDDTDAIVRVDAVTICGTDLHILKGDVPTVTDGRILGHEAVGTVEAVGSRRQDRHGRRPRARVVHHRRAARCRFCREGRYGQCLGGGGWILGHLIDGTQAEFVRVPFADTSTHLVPAGVSRRADPDARRHPPHRLRGRRPQRHACSPATSSRSSAPDPIGLAAIMGARLFSPSHVVAIDLADSRLEAAKQFGADVVVNNGREDAEAVVDELTGRPRSRRLHRSGRSPGHLRAAPSASLGPAAHVANIGVHGEPATLHLEELWIRDVTITTGLVDTYSTPTLLRLVTSTSSTPTRFVTHHFTLDEFVEAYDVFAHAADTGALKVVLTR